MSLNSIYRWSNKINLLKVFFLNVTSNDGRKCKATQMFVNATTMQDLFKEWGNVF